jgi:two-component system chemotaxis family response regulator WspR
MLAERMRARVEALGVEHRASGVAAHLTVSLGVASVVPGPAIRPEDLVDLADRALYAAKEAGRNRVLAAEDLPADPAAAKLVKR